MIAARERPWGSFPDTILHFAPPGGPVVDLRAPPPHDLHDRLSRLGLRGQFSVITAQDPMGVGQDATTNRRLADELQGEVAARGVPAVAVDAGSPDRSHAERSLAVALGYGESVELARRFRQLAIFWFDGSHFWIVPVEGRGAELRLPPDASAR